jgi:tetratricopeptide (TPR) repeat protein
MLCTAVLFTALWSAHGRAFRSAAIGAQLPEARLKTFEGKSGNVFRPEVQVNLILFFRPDQEYSRTALAVLGPICDRYAKRAVACAAIVSDYYRKDVIAPALEKARWPSARTFIDKEDFYGDKLGVILYPAVGIADGSRKLRVFEPFTKVNFGPRIEADLKYLLGDLSENQWQSALIPPVQEALATQNDLGRINYNFAKRLFDAGKWDKAVRQAERALSLDPTLADAHALIGLVRAKQGHCELAKPLFQKALALDKNNAQASKGMASCP